MRIYIRSLSNSDYTEVKIIEDNTTIDLGLLDASQLKDLAGEFEEAADELLRRIR